MKSIVALSSLLLSFLSFGQYEPLKGIDPDSSGYYILGTFSESDENSLQDSLREWYIDEISTIKELKQLWKFDEEAPFYACGYHYHIMLCKNGVALEDFYVNLNCSSIVSNGKSYVFDSSKLRFIYGKTKRFYKEPKETGITEGRNYLDSIRNQPRLIYAPDPIWKKYEGEFEFTYNYEKGTEAYFPELEKRIKPKLLKYCPDSILEKLKLDIQKAYPDEEFEISDYGGSLTEVFVRITCNKTLDDKFNLYAKEFESQEWEYFEPRFSVYWIFPSWYKGN